MRSLSCVYCLNGFINYNQVLWNPYWTLQPRWRQLLLWHVQLKKRYELMQLQHFLTPFCSLCRSHNRRMVQQETFFKLSIDWITNLWQEMQGYQLQRFLSISTKSLDCTVDYLQLGRHCTVVFECQVLLKKFKDRKYSNLVCF